MVIRTDLSLGAVILYVRIMFFVGTPASRALPYLQPLVRGDVCAGRLRGLVRGRQRLLWPISRPRPPMTSPTDNCRALFAKETPLFGRPVVSRL